MPTKLFIVNPIEHRATMKIFLAILIVLVLVMLFTRPNAEAHKQAIVKEVIKASKSSLDNNAVICWDISDHSKQLGIEQLVAQQLEVKNFWLCSVGSLNRQGQQQHVSLGIFGHVFCTGIH